MKTGFAKDENNNQIPDAWEKRFKFLFTFENIIILILGILEILHGVQMYAITTVLHQGQQVQELLTE